MRNNQVKLTFKSYNVYVDAYIKSKLEVHEVG